MSARLSVLAAAATAGDQEALVVRGQRIAFEALAERAARAAHVLRERGAGPGAPVSLEPELDLATCVWIHAALALGAPLLLQPSRVSERERARQRGIAGARVHLRPGDAPPTSGPLLTPEPADAASPAAIVFTSGTTGQPKGAVLSRRALVAAADASATHLGWREDDRWYLTLPPAHVGGLSVLVRCLLARKAVVLGPPSFSVGATRRDLSAHRATLLSLVPTMLHRLLEAGWRGPGTLRAVLLGGAPATARLLERAEDARIPVLPTYGATETSAQAATREPGTPPTAAAGVGRPLPGVELRVVDGRVQLRGPTLFDGYLRPDGRLDPARDAEGFWDSGDLGALDEAGRLHLRGRRSDLILSGGENVYPAEVEARLAEHLASGELAVVGVPDDEWGERVAVAFEGVDSGRVRAAIARAGLAPHQRPRLAALVAALPRTPSGKIDRAATRALAFRSLEEAGR